MSLTFQRYRIIACLVLLLGSITPSLASGSQIPVDLVPLLQNRADIALKLSRPISECVVRRDSAYPVFHGCIDWHSSVHGMWALVAYTRLTGDRRYQPTIDAELKPESIAQEEAFVDAHPSFEMPYGRAWFLRLAIEYGRAYKSKLLDHMGDAIARSLFDRYQHQTPHPFSAAYRSDSWALINLMDYYAYRGDAEKLALVRGIVRRSFVVRKPARCDQDRERPEFMAICTNVAWAVSKAVSRPVFLKWIAQFLPPSALAGPIHQPTTAHEHGLNFSRAWGLWAIYSETDEPAYIHAYVDSFNAGYQDTQGWDGDYGTVRHWVAQFGTFALSPLFGNDSQAIPPAPFSSQARTGSH